MEICAQETSEQEYINKLAYRRNRLSLTIKTKTIGEKRTYTVTDITSTTYSIEAYTQTYGSIATTGLQRVEEKEITDWFIYKGGVRELNDLEFLELVGDRQEYLRVKQIDEQKAKMRLLGNISIGLGLATMLGGAAFSSGQNVITGGAIVTTIGFFISAFNLAPHHYLQPDYAQEKIDEYNISLKKKYNLPLTFE